MAQLRHVARQVKKPPSNGLTNRPPRASVAMNASVNGGNVPRATGTQTVRRIIDILRLMASHRGNGLRFVEVADLAQLERPTAHRMLKALVEGGMVYRESATRRYFLGPLLFELGLIAARQFDLRELCTPSLRRLAERTGDTSFLFVRNGTDAVCIERIQGNHPIQTPFVPVGGRQPLGISAGGLALLSALSDAEITKIITANESHLAEYGGLTNEELLRLVRDAQRRQYALIGERAVPNVTAVGIVLRNRTDIPIGAFAVATTTDRMTPARQKEIALILKQESEEISKLLRHEDNGEKARKQ